MMSAITNLNASDVASVASSRLSTTSTEEFEHKPFSTFRNKVMQLCKQNWLDLAADAFEIARMEGGSYNRVISVKVDDTKKNATCFNRCAKRFLSIFTICAGTDRKSQTKEYVIRMPRYEQAWTEYEIAILLFLSKQNVPVPKIRSFSLSPTNPLGTRYSIQPRLPGKDLDEGVYVDLTTSQRITFARSLGAALKQLSTITSPCPGTLDPASILDGPSSPDPRMLRLQWPPPNALRPLSTEPLTPSTPMSIYDFITSQLTRQREYDISLSRVHLDPWSKFRIIINALHSEGLFSDPTYHLTHMDLEPRNILIDPTTATLSGILDWDKSVFGPAFLGCRPAS
jgi:hypothetical protein